jgi:hypothetical protein
MAPSYKYVIRNYFCKIYKLAYGATTSGFYYCSLSGTSKANTVELASNTPKEKNSKTRKNIQSLCAGVRKPRSRQLVSTSHGELGIPSSGPAFYLRNASTRMLGAYYNALNLAMLGVSDGTRAK